ncbi:MAG TPA: diacylglycerol kinase family protein [Tepidisphaeraceae bacterium]|nr:diacylglycerol kinase family protein [Tepidisphaeraceae bacterium]
MPTQFGSAAPPTGPHAEAPTRDFTAPAHPRHGLIASFRFAFAGIAYLFRTQRNARIHAAIATAACGLALWLGLSRIDWCILLLTIAGVLILEGLNTALEAVVDLASPHVHPLAKVAKDVAAGMVLIAAIASVAVGLLIFGPPLWAKLAP